MRNKSSHHGDTTTLLASHRRRLQKLVVRRPSTGWRRPVAWLTVMDRSCYDGRNIRSTDSSCRDDKGSATSYKKKNVMFWCKCTDDGRWTQILWDDAASGWINGRTAMQQQTHTHPPDKHITNGLTQITLTKIRERITPGYIRLRNQMKKMMTTLVATMLNLGSSGRILRWKHHYKWKDIGYIMKMIRQRHATKSHKVYKLSL